MKCKGNKNEFRSYPSKKRNNQVTLMSDLFPAFACTSVAHTKFEFPNNHHHHHHLLLLSKNEQVLTSTPGWLPLPRPARVGMPPGRTRARTRPPASGSPTTRSRAARPADPAPGGGRSPGRRSRSRQRRTRTPGCEICLFSPYYISKDNC